MLNKKCREGQLARQELIGQIAVGIAHEIRNPLTVVKGYMQLLNKYPDLPCRSLDAVFAELEHIETVVTNMVLLARNKAIEKTPQDINVILRSLFPLIREEVVAKGSFVELILAENIPQANLSTEEVRRLVLILVHNALEAMPDSGKLTIKTCCQKDEIILLVQDEGGGIPVDKLNKIFDPFFTTKDGKTGLGLAISSSIVERHGGRIEVKSTVGEGSVFRVILPVWNYSR